MSLALDEEARLAATARLLGRPNREALEAALAALGDRSWRVRKAAVDAIVAHPDRSAALEGLIAGLRAEANAGERNSAAEALVRIGGAATPALLERITDADPDVRKFVVDVLGEIAEPQSVPALVGALSDGDENVRAAAAEALGKIGDERAVAGLLAALEGGDLWLQHAVLAALGRLGRPLPRPLLTRLGGHPQLRRAVFDLIGQVRDAAAVDLVLGGIADRGRGTREAAIVALWAVIEAHPALAAPLAHALGRPEGSARTGAALAAGADPGPGWAAPVGWREAAASALESPAAGVRVAAGALLALAGDGRGVPPLVAAVGDERLRDSALVALRTAGPRAAAALGAMLSDPDGTRRELAAALLGELPAADNDLDRTLAAALGDPAPAVRAAAARALGRRGAAACGDAVAALLADPSEEVQAAAVEALALLAAVDGPAALAGRAAPLLSADDAGRRRAAVALLGRMGDLLTERSSGPAGAAPRWRDESADQIRAAFGQLAFALKDPDAGVRQAAATALGRLGGDDALEPLALALADEAPEVRIAAAGALGRLRSPSAVEPLTLLVGDPDPWVCAAALEALGAIGAPAGFRAITAALAAADPLVVLAAVEAAAAVGGDAAVPHLLPLLGSPEPDVVKGVVRQLARLGGPEVTGALLPLLEAADWGVRAAAAEALGTRRAPAARAALTARLAVEEDDLTRAALRRALDALG